MKDPFRYSIPSPDGRCLWFGWNEHQWALLLTAPGVKPHGLSEVLAAGPWN